LKQLATLSGADPYSVRVSRDGRRVSWVMAAGQAGAGQLKVALVDGSQVRVLAENVGTSCAVPTWLGNSSDLFVIGADGTRPVVNSTPGDSHGLAGLSGTQSCSVQFSPDGTLVAGIEPGGEVSVWRTDGRGGRLYRVTPRADSPGIVASLGALSPDGKQ